MIKTPFKNRPYARSVLYALLLLAVLLPAWWWAGLRYKEQLLNEKRAQISVIAAATASSLRASMNRRVTLLKGLKAFVDTRIQAAQGIGAGEFTAFAGGLLTASSGIRNLAVSPEGVEPLVYPETVKAGTFSSDAFRDRQILPKTDAQRALRSRRPVVSGPYMLSQKEPILQVAQAAYLGDSPWGVVSMTLSLTPLFSEAGLDSSPAGLALVLRDRSGHLLYGKKDAVEESPVLENVELPEGSWKLAVIPEKGWAAAVAGPLLQFRSITLAVVLLLVALICVLATYRMRLKMAVRERTGELQRMLTDRREEELRLNRTLAGLRQAMGAVLDTMALAVEAKDPRTAGHQRRTADLSRAIATEMELAEEAIDGLRMAAAIHDIGKICLPAQILEKPEELADLELNLVKTHAQAGYEILKEMDFPWPVARIVWQHHERLDGSGYPMGLPASEIMKEARILAVADVVEAMMSQRSNRPVQGLEKALEEIENGRGVLYDPAVVDACLRIFREKDFSLT